MKEVKTKRLALVLFCLFCLVGASRYFVVGREVRANMHATYAERSLQLALRQFGSAMPRRFLEDNLRRLERARELDPASVEVIVSHAGYLFLLHRYEAAERVYFEALALEERAEIHANLARLYMQTERPEKAIESLQKALWIDPQLTDQLQPMLEAARREAEARKAAENNAGLPASSPELSSSAGPPPGVIFSDDFESGDFGRWSRVVQRS